MRVVFLYRQLLLCVLFLLAGCHGLVVDDSGLAPEVENERAVVEREDWPGFAGVRKGLLARYADGTREAEAAAFLIDNLPLVDLVAMGTDELADNVNYALMARRTMKWGQDVPWPFFLQYVLPHRVSQEPFQPWRLQFYEELAPLVADCATMAEAVLELNKWVLGKAGFIKSRPWDQSMLATIKRGGGRCEEKSALFIAAARSVGIPARYAYTPRWQFMDDNHAWVEVWADGAWRFLGAAEPRVALDQTSFNHRLERVALVLASAYGRLDSEALDNVYRRGSDFTLYNGTALYAPVGRLDVVLFDDVGEPLVGEEVFLSLYNYGSLRPIARLITDEDGAGAVDLGKTTVMVTAARGNKSDFALVEVRPGAVSRVEMVLDNWNLAEGDFLFRYGLGPGEANDPKSEAGGPEAELKEQCKLLGAKRQEGLDRFVKLVSGNGLDANLTASLNAAAGGVPESLLALAGVDSENKKILREYLLQAESKDLLEVKAGELLFEIDLATASRKVREAHDLVYDDDIFQRWVVDGRIYYEPFSHWRRDVTRYIEGWPRDLASLVEQVDSHVYSLPRARGSYLGPLLDPGQIIEAGLVTDEVERIIVAVALLRAAGVPARYDGDNDWLEYFDGSDWQVMFPAKLNDSAQNSRQDDAVVEVRFVCGGGELCSEVLEYYKDFTVSRFAERGLWQGLKPEGEVDDESGVYRFFLSAGDYQLIIGRRNENGEPWVRVIPFGVEAGGESRLEVDLADMFRDSGGE